jgi:hypothetical protein
MEGFVSEESIDRIATRIFKHVAHSEIPYPSSLAELERERERERGGGGGEARVGRGVRGVRERVGQGGGVRKKRERRWEWQ